MSCESDKRSSVPIAGLEEKNRNDLQAELASLRQTCARQQLQMQEIQVQLLEVLNSTWWRIGEPARQAGRRYPRLAKIFRFAAWSVGQCYYYYKKGVLLDRIKDYMRRRTVIAQAKENNIVKALGLPEQKILANAQDIVFLPTDSPVVSIVIPAYGNVGMTLRCLSSIARAPPKIPIEVIVAEDASGDPEVKQYRDVRGLHVIERTHNLGFLRSCNDAVKNARGEFVLLLNNDTEVIPSAIDAMVHIFRARLDAGLVGARLLYPDGKQQEAGGIIWADGLAWNYGRFDDPRKPKYNYVREADYISGAAIMLPRSLWDRLGGFDEHFLPAYCEDSDLAFRVRQEGLKVYYQPKAMVIHHEGTTHGAEAGIGLKVYQIENNRKFSERWQSVLSGQHFMTGTHILRARDRSMNKKVTLVIDHYVPEPDRDAGSRTMLKFMQTLQATGRIVKFWPSNSYESPEYSPALQQMGIEVLYGPWTEKFEDWMKKNGSEIDEVLLSRPMIAPMFLPALRKYSDARVVFYGHDLHFMRMEKEAALTGDPVKLSAAQEMKEFERRVWLSVDHVLYPSEEEARMVSAIEPSVQVSAVSPYAFDNSAYTTSHPPANADIIFVASFRHSPNIDAAIWFCNEILPRVRAEHPNAKIALVGAGAPANVQALAGAGVEVTGHITDEELERRYASARVAVAPLRFGAGVKLKVVEALSYGVPMVTTNSGVQGLEGLEKNIEVHDDTHNFAQAVVRLLKDDVLWMARSETQRQYVNHRFSSLLMREGLEAAFATTTSASLGAVA